MSLPEDLLETFVCPVGKAEIEYRDDALVCTDCGRKYRIEEDIPFLLIDEAEVEGNPPCRGVMVDSSTRNQQ